MDAALTLREGPSGQKGVAAPSDYIQRVHAGSGRERERQVRTPQQRLEEALFTGLRLTEGIDLDALACRYGVDAWARYGDALRAAHRRRPGLQTAARLRLTRNGMLVANDVMVVFV